MLVELIIPIDRLRGQLNLISFASFKIISNSR